MYASLNNIKIIYHFFLISHCLVWIPAVSLLRPICCVFLWIYLSRIIREKTLGVSFSEQAVRNPDHFSTSPCRYQKRFSIFSFSFPPMNVFRGNYVSTELVTDFFSLFLVLWQFWFNFFGYLTVGVARDFLEQISKGEVSFAVKWRKCWLALFKMFTFWVWKWNGQ